MRADPTSTPYRVKKVMRICLASLLAAAALAAGASTALAATATGTFNSQIAITSQCLVVTTNTLDFGTAGVIAANIDTTANFDIQCTNGTTYTLSLDAGSGTGTTTTRTMENGAEDVAYIMTKDAARTLNWGDTGAEIMTGLSGNGSAQTYTVYGRVAAQATPTGGLTYTDLVTITVTYP